MTRLRMMRATANDDVSAARSASVPGGRGGPRHSARAHGTGIRSALDPGGPRGGGAAHWWFWRALRTLEQLEVESTAAGGLASRHGGAPGASARARSAERRG